MKLIEQEATRLAGLVLANPPDYVAIVLREIARSRTRRAKLIQAIHPRHSMTTNHAIYGLGFTGIDLDFPLDLGRVGRVAIAMMDAMYGRKRSLVS